MCSSYTGHVWIRVSSHVHVRWVWVRVSRHLRWVFTHVQFAPKSVGGPQDWWLLCKHVESKNRRGRMWEHIYDTGWQRDIGCPIFLGHFLHKSPVISGSFAERDLQLKALYASSPPCMVCLGCWAFKMSVFMYEHMWVLTHVRPNILRAYYMYVKYMWYILILMILCNIVYVIL